MDFRQRLEKATERGHRTRSAKAREETVRALSEEEFQRLHIDYRVALIEHIEDCLKQLADNSPGFQFERVMRDRGWGAGVRRDDVGRSAHGRRASFFSHLEMVVSPLSEYHVLELRAKATIRNKEILNRSKYQLLAEVDMESFVELVELWVLEYAELFAAQA